MTPSDEIVAREWRCFHCDEVFTDIDAAADHFGVQIDGTADEVACKLNATDGLLVKMLREAQEELRRYRQEDHEAYRQFYALGAEHATALHREEEKGYARGLADGHAEALRTPKPTPTQPGTVELYSRRVPTTTDYPWVEYERNTAAERCIHALREMLKYDGCDGADWHALRFGDARQAAKAALASLDRGGST